MNKAILKGRLTKDVELKTTSNGTNYCNFSIAVDRKYKDNNGNKQTDFINCVAWRNSADFISRYFGKGSEILVTGEINTRSYDDQNGQKRTVTEVLVNEVEFVGSKPTNASEGTQSAPQAPVAPTAPVEIETDTEELELPFEI